MAEDDLNVGNLLETKSHRSPAVEGPRSGASYPRALRLLFTSVAAGVSLTVAFKALMRSRRRRSPKPEPSNAAAGVSANQSEQRD
jgi:hypothetical protein